jgi:hypothetical protein
VEGQSGPSEATRPTQIEKLRLYKQPKRRIPMRRFLMSIAVMAALTTAVMAGPKNGGGQSSKGNGSSSSHVQPTNLMSTSYTQSWSKMHYLSPTYTGKDYHLKYGTKYDFGYCFKGYDHYHWSYRCFFDRYGCD